MSCQLYHHTMLKPQNSFVRFVPTEEGLLIHFDEELETKIK
uniref:Uncharacterized protein n=1 Tax=Anguilla anguilla TaxID=7936 RepID=A0A0E9VYU2_ANGAN